MMRGWETYLAPDKLDMVARLRHFGYLIKGCNLGDGKFNTRQTERKEDQSSQSSSKPSLERYTRS
jgi:hypothetical protein